MVSALKEIEISSFEEFIHRITEVYNNGQWVFRGVKDRINHKLIPSVGRLKISKSDFPFFEKEIFKRFKMRARGKLKLEPTNDLEWMALAQHHGLPTRLLDWSVSPLVAAFFATQPELYGNGELVPCCKNGGAIYAYNVPEYYDTESLKDAFVGGIHIFYAPHVTERITGQSGLFTIQSNPQDELNYPGIELHMHKIVFDCQTAIAIQKALYFLGIRQGLLFPDLDGISNDLKTELVFGNFQLINELNTTIQRVRDKLDPRFP